MKRKQWKNFLIFAGTAVLLTCGGCSHTAEVDSSGTGPEESRTEVSLPEEETGTGESTGEISGENDFKPTAPEESRDDERPEKPDGESGGTDQKEEVPYQIIENIILATDIHYFDPSLTDYGPRFQEMVEYGDGKVVTYIDEITDAFLEEVIQLRPNALILSGDLTLEGEKKSHESLAEKLYRVEEAGIPVLVIPGNHDINNKRAARYEGEQRLPAEYTTPEEFRKIYRDFGYEEAISEDVRSLSYVYQLDEEHRIMMLDTCQYRPVAKVGGAILSETYYWIEEQLEEAWDEAMDVIPVAHHNLLEESKIYVDDCTIEHGEQLVDILDEWDVKLFLSGHLHVQHTMRSEDNRGVWEAVTASLATPACQYGVLTCRDDGSYQYGTWSVDVESWAGEHGRKERDLLEFRKFQEPFLRKVFYNQSMAALNAVPDIPEDRKKQMSDLYAKLNYYYYQGTAYQIKNEVLSDPAYRMWLNEGTLTVLGEYVEYIVSDAVQDYNRLVVD